MDLTGAAAFSVVMPARDAAAHLVAALDSVASQTFRRYEVVVVDDGSSDGTADLARRWGADHPEVRLTVLRQDGAGPAAARNAGIAAAGGDFVAFLDADDRWLPRKLERVAASVARAPQADVFAHDIWVAAGEEVVERVGCGPHQTYEEHLFGGNVLSTSATVVRRAALERVGCFDTNPDFAGVEDWDLWLRLARAGSRFVYLHEPLTIYREEGTGITGRARRQHERWQNVAEAHWSAWPDWTWRRRLAASRMRGAARRGAWHELMRQGRPADARRMIIAGIGQDPSSPKTLALAAASLTGTAGLTAHLVTARRRRRLVAEGDAASASLLQEAGSVLAARAGRVLVVADRLQDTGALHSGALDSDAVDSDAVDSDVLLLTSDARGARVDARSTRLLPAARLVDEEVSALREQLPGWARELGGTVVGGRNVREWFDVAGRGTSAWWFSHLAERNPLKTDAFLRMAQARVVGRLLPGASRLVLHLHDEQFASALAALAARHGVPVEGARRRSRPRPGRATLVARAFARGAAHAGREWAFAALAAAALRGRRPALPRGEVDWIVVSYFPHLDEDAARRGVFVDRYGGGLQPALESHGRRVLWAWMRVGGFASGNRRAVLRLVASLRRGGAGGLLLAELWTMRGVARTVRQWVRQAWSAWRLLGALDDDALAGTIGSAPATAPLVRGLLAESFAGRTGVSGLMALEVFERLLPSVRAGGLLYYLEMQGWEAALNAARRRLAPSVRTVGFAHSSVRENYFPYRPDPRDLSAGAPLPDVIAVNGAIPRRTFDGWPVEVAEVEATRTMHVGRLLAAPVAPAPEGTPVVLVAGTIDPAENAALEALLADAFGGADDGRVRVRVRRHPAEPFARGYESADGPLEAELAGCHLVVAGGTTLALEALAAGRPVAVPLFPDVVCLSTIAGHDVEGWQRVCGGRELADLVARWHRDPPDPEPGRAFVASYWHLEAGLPRWRALLATAAAP